MLVSFTPFNVLNACIFTGPERFDGPFFLVNGVLGLYKDLDPK